jgi:hypothetical protein
MNRFIWAATAARQLVLHDDGADGFDGAPPPAG